MPAPNAWGYELNWREIRRSHEARCPACRTPLSENPKWRDRQVEGGQVVGFDPRNITDRNIVGRLIVYCANDACRKPFWFGVPDTFYIERLTASEADFQLYSGDGSYEEFMSKREHLVA